MSTSPRGRSNGPAGAPLVTVVVPVYNGERYLRECLDSILAQTHPRVEVLVMDDASTDATPAIVAAYGDRVRHFRQPQNRGQFENVNDGVGRARGDYVCVYHADDLYDPRIVEREVEFLGRFPEAGAVFCADVFIDAEGREYDRLRLPPEVRGGRPLAFPVILNALLEHQNRFLRCPSSMVRAAVYREVGPYRPAEFRNNSDLEMWLRIARRHPVGIIEEHLFRYRHFHGSSSQSYQRLRTDPHRYFKIMDLCLREGGLAVATREALAAHEAHRAEDGLKRAANHYILGRRAEALAALGGVSLGRLLGSPRVQRGRLLLLFLALQALARLPRSARVADLLTRRWYGRGGGRVATPRLRGLII